MHAHTHRLEQVRVHRHANIHCGKFPFLSGRLNLASSNKQTSTVLSSEQGGPFFRKSGS